MATKTIIWLSIPAGILLALQAFQIDKTPPVSNPEVEFHLVADPPDAIMGLLKHACYDCHSNNTRYPWYASVQPVAWWLQSHVKTGRSELNFSEFGRWTGEDQADALRHCAKLIHQDAMPLGSYTRMHPDARLSPKQNKQLVEWLLERADGFDSPLAKPVGMKQVVFPKDTCDDNDANPRCCFIGMPDRLTTTLTIAPEGEPGARLFIKGYVFKKDGKTPYPNVLMYAYQTDTTGRYTRKGDETGIYRRHGRLRAWARTDEQGRYAIETIRPVSYPNSKISAHIHAVVWEPESKKEPYYIPEFEFADDPFLSPSALGKARKNPGQSGIITLGKDAATGILTARRDIVLKGVF